MIRFYWKRHRQVIVLATITSVASAALSMALVAHVNRVAAVGLTGGSLPGAATAVVLVVAAALANLVSQWLIGRMSADVVANLRDEVARSFLALDYDQLLAREHLVTSALMSDVQRLAPVLMLLPQLLFNGLTVAFCIVYMGVLAPKLLAVFLTMMVGVALCLLLVLRRTDRLVQRLRKAEGSLFEEFHAIAAGKKELKLSQSRTAHFLADVLGDGIAAVRRLTLVAQRWWAFGDTTTSSFTFCAVFAVIYAAHARNQPAAETMQFVIVALFLTRPVVALFTAVQTIIVGMASIRHLESVGAAPWRNAAPAPLASSGDVRPPAWAGNWQTIRAHGLTYEYRGADERGFRLGPADLTIHRGEILFLVGGNGGGKSTLLLLLSGLLHPDEGSLEVDGIPVDRGSIQHYRNLFTGVFADFHIFRHVIDRRGDVVADATVNAWLEKLAIRHVVSASDGELSSTQVSQGQRKRLALTQCYVDDADIYVFDEWAADQDPHFRAFFYSTLLPELKARGKTTVIVTHDERFFPCADRVLQLEHGRIIPAGDKWPPAWAVPQAVNDGLSAS